MHSIATRLISVKSSRDNKFALSPIGVIVFVTEFCSIHSKTQKATDHRDHPFVYLQGFHFHPPLILNPPRPSDILIFSIINLDFISSRTIPNDPDASPGP